MGRLKYIIMVMLLLYGCADSSSVIAESNLKYSIPIKKQIIHYDHNRVSITYTMYASPEKRATYIYATTQLKDKRKLPKNYMDLVNRDGNKFILQYCPKNVNNFSYLGLTVGSKHVIAGNLACFPK